MFELASNVENRSKWDERWVKCEKLDDAEAQGGAAHHIEMKKPPIPFVSARDIVATFWKDDSAFEGKKCQYSTSIEHSGCPPNKNF